MVKKTHSNVKTEAIESDLPGASAEKPTKLAESSDSSKPSDLETLRLQIRDLTDTLKRVQADFENYRKRIERERADFVTFAGQHVVKEILPIIDNLELAFANEQSPEDFKKGIELIYAQFQDFLHNQNIAIIPTKDQKFDPYLHEAMMQDHDARKEDGVTLAEFQKGYKIGEKVIRHSKVKINRVPKNAGTDVNSAVKKSTTQNTNKK